MSDIMPCPHTFEEMMGFLETNEMEIEKELIRTPVRIQQAADEAARLGKLLNDLKIEEKTTRALLWKKASYDPVTGKKWKSTEKNVEDKENEVNEEQAMVDIRLKINSAEQQYQRWYDLVRSFRNKQQALDQYATMVVSGYVGYKRAAIPASTI